MIENSKLFKRYPITSFIMLDKQDVSKIKKAIKYIASKLTRHWCWREELNPRPTDYESVALPTELLQQEINLLFFI